ncbi:glycosyltransferase [Psychrobacter sp. 28M-43]|uniref:glycosyltransferase n=1 Tax=Psychrobacter sp. 28M-43 TaxID=2772254 RepID=UPI00168CCEC9|nr:glycosyltransferase [Psychrobacter sp. 28M-43]QOD11858.1 glycosyltransferase [Psychrobacter sp. 28M-43]
MKKIAIFLPNLKGGGAERVFVNLSNAFVKRGFEVDIILIQECGELLDSLDKEVHIIDLDKKRIRQSFIPLISYLKKNKPDAFITVMWPLTVIGILAFRLSSCNGSVIVSDHNTLSLSTAGFNRLKKAILAKSIKYFYPLADIRLAVSKGVSEDIKHFSGLKNCKIDVIYNPVLIHSENEFLTKPKTERLRVINVGSFKTQKNQSLLIKAFAKIAHIIDVELVILGDGPLRTDLEALVQELNLSNYVIFLGFKKDVTAEYIKSDLFVLSSDYEGFGNVLVEAMSVGTPVVSTDCKSGPREILCDGKYGKLVPVNDVDALAQAMLQSLQEEHDVEGLKRRAADFSVDKIASQYLDIMFPERLVKND